ncbi:substrate-binding periplasmic protein [Kordiimonas laminariae]|uniref:substrate-binding periplasmic protein n=1 Tax=Kordiimonas laminariae TaxID=2917717 RepID=UPI001FF5AF88|nr:ABC transporter substrate-binding protein [Kordiimonas laminariae]MCK0068748.1 ABC transporter substrate-binding protein [Kordiimonas laminariae]
MSFLLSFAGAALLQATPISMDEQLHLITEENYPFTYTDQTTGKVTGTVSEIIFSLMKKADIQYTLAVMPHKRGKREALKKNHCIFAFNETSERLPHYTWVGPILIGGWAFYTRSENLITAKSLDDLRQYKIAATDGTANTSTLKKLGGFDMVLTPTDDVALNMLVKGRVDIMSGGVIDVTSTVRKQELPEPKMIYYWRKAILSMGCGRETDPTTIERLNTLNSQRIDYQPRD